MINLFLSTTISQLTPVGGTFSGVSLLNQPTTQNSYSNLIKQTGNSLGHTNSTLLQSTSTSSTICRFPTTGHKELYQAQMV